ncbi:hypothetical protein ACFL6U_01245 [Planctomycetota bacterium]
MESSKNNNKLDRLIKNATPGPMAEPNFEAWAQEHSADIACLKTQASSPPAAPSTLLRILRVAATILIVLGLGFWGGRLSSDNQPNLKQLRADLEASLTQQCLGTVEAGYQQLRQDILAQLHQDMEVLAGQTLVASKQITDQQVLRMIRLIDETRLRDRQHIAAAFEQLESKRLQDMEQLSSGLQHLATHSNQPEFKQIHQ